MLGQWKKLQEKVASWEGDAAEVPLIHGNWRGAEGGETSFRHKHDCKAMQKIVNTENKDLNLRQDLDWRIFPVNSLTDTWKPFRGKMLTEGQLLTKPKLGV